MSRILCVFWHRINPDSANGDIGGNPTRSIFRAQVRYLAENYTPISIFDFLRIIECGRTRQTFNRAPVLLGFDDGFKSIVRDGVPVLIEFGAPAVFFVMGESLLNPAFVPWFLEIRHIVRKAEQRQVTINNVEFDLDVEQDRQKLGRILRTELRACRIETKRQQLLGEFASRMRVRRPTASELDEDLQLADRHDLGALARSSVLTVASHAMSHRYLDSLSDAEQALELRESDAVLRQYCPSYCPVIAYPSGSFNRATTNIARDVYKAGFGVVAGCSHRDRYAYPRVGLEASRERELPYILSSIRLDWLLPLKRMLNAAGLHRE